MTNQASPVPPAPPKEQPKRHYQPCPCGKTPERLMLEVQQDSKVGRAYGDCCGTWAVEFLRGIETNHEKILDKAHTAWDTAPRGW